MKLPEMWDIQDRRKVEQPDLTAPHLIQHSSLAMADRMELAMCALPRDAQERFMRALFTVETLAIIMDRARKGQPFI